MKEKGRGAVRKTRNSREDAGEDEEGKALPLLAPLDWHSLPLDKLDL